MSQTTPRPLTALETATALRRVRPTLAVPRQIAEMDYGFPNSAHYSEEAQTDVLVSAIEVVLFYAPSLGVRTHMPHPQDERVALLVLGSFLADNVSSPVIRLVEYAVHWQTRFNKSVGR